MKNYDDILNDLLKIEEKYNLFDILDENKTPKWIFLRWQFMSLYFYWEKKHNFLNIKSDPKIFWFVKRSFLWFFKYLFLIFKIRKIKNIVLVPEKSIYKNINLISSFMEGYLDEEVLFLEIPTNHLNKWKEIKHRYYIPLDFLFWLKLVYFFIYKFLYKNSYKEFEPIINLLDIKNQEKFKYEILYKDASRKFSNFLMKTLFKNKKIYHVGDIIGFSFINSPNIIEIQFWLFNKMRYTFPKNKYINNYLKNEKIIIYQGYLVENLIKNWYKKNNLYKIDKKPEIDTFIKKFKNTKIQKNNKKKILIIEQPTNDRYKILNNIFDLLLKWNKYTNIDFWFKQHPNSYKKFDLDNWIKKIKFYWNNIHIYRLLNDYDYILSIDSTVIFEAKQFWLNIITITDQSNQYKENVNNLIWDYNKCINIKLNMLEELLNNL